MNKQSPKTVLADYEEKMSLDQATTFLETIVKKFKRREIIHPHSR